MDGNKVVAVLAVLATELSERTGTCPFDVHDTDKGMPCENGKCDDDAANCWLKWAKGRVEHG